LGTQPPDPSWGTMVNAGQALIELSPWPVVFPGLAIVLAVLAFNLIGDGLRGALAPRLRSGLLLHHVDRAGSSCHPERSELANEVEGSRPGNPNTRSLRFAPSSLRSG